LLRWYTTVVDARDHRAQAAWWARALGWQVFLDTDDEAVVIRAVLADPEGNEFCVLTPRSE
jgi:hypothetical protein